MSIKERDAIIFLSKLPTKPLPLLSPGLLLLYLDVKSCSSPLFTIAGPLKISTSLTRRYVCSNVVSCVELCLVF